MAKPTTRSEFREYCLRKLGHPVDMFLDNKYTTLYFNIIANAHERNWNKNDAGVYTENHHVIPESMFKNDFCVRLTAREHFIAHYILTKMTCGDNQIKMFWAFGNMRRDAHGKRYMNSRLYASLKGKYTHTQETISKFSKSHRETLSKKIMTVEERERRSAVRRGSEIPESVREKIRASSIGKAKSEYHKRNMILARQNTPRPDISGSSNPMYGRTGDLSPHYGKQQTEEHKEKRLSCVRGRKHSEEARMRMSENHTKTALGKSWYNDGAVRRRFFANEVPEGFIKGKHFIRGTA